VPRNLKIFLAFLAVAVIVGLISLRSLRRRVQGLGENQSAEEQARREVLAPPISTPTDVVSAANIYWSAGPDKVAPVQIQLPLSADAVQRARQVLQALVTKPPTPDQRTLPADTILLAFYALPDGTGVADFSDALSSELPSGILSEKVAVDSIAQTLAGNVPSLRRLKILIHGQEVDTLAGHIDLTGFLDLSPEASQQTPSAPASTSAPPSTPTPAAPANR